MLELGQPLQFHPKPVTPAQQTQALLFEGYYRRGSAGVRYEVNFLFCGGGIGDYLCWLQSIQWILDTQKQIIVNLYLQDFMLEIGHKLFEGKFKNTLRIRNIMDLLNADLTKIGPTFQPKNELFPNSMGMHLTDLGFAMFANATPEGPYRWHPRLDVSAVEVPFELPEKYAIVTTGHTTPAREWRPKGINGVAQALKEGGITPVFLGKKEIFKAEAGTQSVTYQANFSGEVDFSVGLDLREKTTLLQAAKIMKNALVVIGLDNGLLHLAGTQDVPIIMGMNIAKPLDREIRRPKGSGLVQYISPDPNKLSCTFCQSNQRFNSGQDFKYCLYKDYKCLDILGEPGPWINAIRKLGLLPA